MRRVSAQQFSDRLVLSVYWLLSGYGLRASRAFLAYMLMVVALTAAVATIGLQKQAGVFDVALYILANTTALARPNVSLSLTTTGSYLQFAARLVGLCCSR